MPYIYALFAERTDPREFVRTVQYADPTAAFRQVTSFGRYSFGIDHCDFGKARIVIAKNDEQVPDAFRKDQSFALFDVYIKR